MFFGALNISFVTDCDPISTVYTTVARDALRLIHDVKQRRVNDPSSPRKWGPKNTDLSIVLGLWVPAFAGTTALWIPGCCASLHLPPPFFLFLFLTPTRGRAERR